MKAEIEGLRRSLSEALEQQTATSEILRVISSSPGDIQPVFDAIAANAARLCDAVNGLVIRFDGQLLHLAAHHNVDPERLAAVRQAYPRPPSRGALSGRAILTRAVVHVPDVSKDPEYTLPAATTIGYRSVLAVPMMHEGVARGTILVARDVVAPFSDTHIALIQTFADQAVIAIENVRLFTETEEALARQTATSEILRVIASSPTDFQPVFDAIVESTLRLCDGLYSGVYLVRGDMVHLVAHNQRLPEAAHGLKLAWPMPVQSPASLICRAIRERAIVHVSDTETDPTVPESSRERSRVVDQRAILAVPMLREGVPIGAIRVARREPKPFSDTQVELLQTFADQAVIALENVRLFTELQEKNRALTQAHVQVTESLEQQTATSEILRVISGSPTDTRPVFETIAQSAVRLCGSLFSAVFTFTDGLMWLVAHRNFSPDAVKAMEALYPARPGRETASGRAILDRTIVEITDVLTDPEYGRDLQSKGGWRSTFAVPMLRQGTPIGAIAVGWADPGPASPRNIALLQTFADQAVIAIENARLFNETKEALEQQTATSEILRVISSSPTDLSPVFDAVVASAARLCEAQDVALLLVDRDELRTAAGVGPLYRSVPPDFALRLTRDSVATRAVVDGTTIHVEDFAAESDEEFPVGRELARRFGHRTMLAVPLLRDGVPIGVVCAFRLEVRPFPEQQIALLRTFADQAVIAIENVRLFTELQEKNRALTRAHAQVTEALEQQTATSEILRVISSSPTDLQPVMDAVAKNAARVCGATDASIRRIEGDTLRLVARFGPMQSGAPDVIPISRDYPTGRSVIERRMIHIDDILPLRETEFPRVSREVRTVLATPLLREGVPIGAIVIRRAEVQPFTEGQIALLQTFADQAVIAIENVRLFTELKEKNRALMEALEQQTATSEILQVISQSPTEVAPVFETIVRNAVRLCGASHGGVYRFDGKLIHSVAHDGFTPEELDSWRRTWPQPATGPNVIGRAITSKTIVRIGDIESAPELADLDPAKRANLRARGTRSLVAVPMRRQDDIIGAIGLAHPHVEAFSDAHVELLRTFADQAVIAIENVRLFTELQEKNEALTQAHAQVTEALEQQTATSEILRTIARAQTEVQPVFDTIVRSAARLCHAVHAAVFVTDGRTVDAPANYGSVPEALEAARARFPRPLAMDSTASVAILTRAVVHVRDVEEPSTHDFVRQSGELVGFRSVVTVPMLREGEAIGAILVARREAGRFPDAELQLLRTFADQAVIAVENVRLFKELQARTEELTRSVDQLTALGEVGRAVSSTLDLETVLTTIVSRAVQLSGLDAGVVFEYDANAEEFVQRAATETGEALAEARRSTRIRKGEGALGRTAITLEPVQVPDITVPGAHESRLREILIESGVRAVLVIPMLRESQLIGCLGVTRNSPGEFAAEIIDLLRTFATQSALAIQNARLFQEIADKSRQLEVTSQHKSEFLANMSHELRTPLNAVIGFSEVLAEGMFGEINDKQAEYLRDILESGRHLLSLINDILDLSKIEAGRMDLELVDFHLPTAIDNALTLVRERASRRGLTVQANVDERLGEVRADERKIKQVLLNLLSNAIKFTPDGGRVHVRAVPVDGSVELSVSDTGVGIAPEDQDAVFEEFRQVGTADKKAEGTGLGLTLCKKFVELHGGRIWVKSQVGVGSTFTFTMPVRRGE